MIPEIPDGDRAYLRGPRQISGGRRGTLTVVDLFSGCGGLTLGVFEAARALGMRADVRLAVERDASVARLYATNFGVPRHRMQSDVGSVFDRSVGRSLS